ncbi:MAG: ATP-binding protein [Dehalococcoidales bacterium]|nr:ATP-binding protein [Dehalococcoidales bacterium]
MVIADLPGQYEIKQFQTSLDHVQAALTLLSLKLQSWAMYLRHNKHNTDTGMDKFQGLYVSEKEVDEILSEPGIRLPGENKRPRRAYSDQEVSIIRQYEEQFLIREKEALGRGVSLRLDTLKNIYKLSRLEVDTILICLLSEFSAKYQKLYAYLQDDITKKAPTLDLVLRFISDTPEDMFRAREYFLPDAPLVKYRLIILQEDHVSGSASLLVKSIHLDEHITGFLSGQDRIDPFLTSCARLIRPEKQLTDLVIADDVRNRLRAIVSSNSNTGVICNLQGARGLHKTDIAEAICSMLNKSMLTVNARILTAPETPSDTYLPLIFREGLLQDAVLYIEDLYAFPGDNRETALFYRKVIQESGHYLNWIILDVEKDWQSENMFTGKVCLNLELPNTTYEERMQSWKKILKENSGFSQDINIGDLAGKFKFHTGQISQAAKAAVNLAKWRDPETGLVTAEDLYAACRKQSGGTLSALARKINPCFRWADIILPVDQMEQLHEICSYMRYYHTVYEDWGFARKSSLGKGLKVLFAGPSGTGKTMAAEVIAGELKIDLYKIDLSTIVSKYIGETEKNLDRIFQEGQTSNAVLFFDEADAIFGKRSEVRDAHDRYANIETAYLLQKMDEYEGTVILATNLRKNMDEAFARRMHFTLEFPLPEEPDRYRIWRQVFPPESPLDNNIDFNFLARQFKISGGNIRNIALGSAFLAAADGGQINMKHLIKTVKREYQKIGKLCTEGDFGAYFELVKN